MIQALHGAEIFRVSVAILMKLSISFSTTSMRNMALLHKGKKVLSQERSCGSFSVLNKDL